MLTFEANTCKAMSRLSQTTWVGVVATSMAACWWYAACAISYAQPYFISRWIHAALFLPSPSLPGLLTATRETVVLATLFFLAALGFLIGSQCVLFIGLHFESSLDVLPVCLGFGWAILALVATLSSLAGAFYPRAILAAALVFGSLAIVFSKRSCPRLRWPRLKWDVETAIAATIFALLAAQNLFGCFMPDGFYDSLVYHLALPDLYRRHHGFVVTSRNLYSGFPMLTEMLYGLGLGVTTDEICHLINWSFGVTTAALIFSICRKLTDERTGLWAALLFFSTPMVGILSWRAGVELSTGFYQLVAVYALSIALEHESLERRKWLVVSGLFCGFAMGTKYTSWILPLILFAISHRKLSWQEVRLAGVSTLTAWAIWPIKDFLWYGNPVYPFFAKSSSPNWRGLLDDGGRRHLTALARWSGLIGYLSHPWTVLTSRRDDTSAIGGIPLMALPIIFLSIRQASRSALFGSAALLCWAAWSLSTTDARFFLPVIPLLAIAAAVAIFDGFSKRASRVMRLASLCAILTNGLWTLTWLKHYGADEVVFGRETRDERLRNAYPSYDRPTYAALEYVNSNLPSDARVLFVGEPRGFRCQRDYLTATVFDEHPLTSMLRASRNTAELLKQFKTAGITHVIFNFAQIETMSRVLPVTDDQLKIYLEFVQKRLKKVYEYRAPQTPDFSQPWCAVYEVES